MWPSYGKLGNSKGCFFSSSDELRVLLLLFTSPLPACPLRACMQWTKFVTPESQHLVSPEALDLLVGVGICAEVWGWVEEVWAWYCG